MMFLYGVATKATPFEDYVNNISIIKITEIMCWKATNKKECIKKIAKNNIPVTKLVYVNDLGEIISACRDFKYNQNIVYTLNFDIAVQERLFLKEYIVESGFHSYATNIKLKFEQRIHLSYCYVFYHDRMKTALATFRNIFGIFGELSIADCIIPKGSAYYLNSNGEYVSDSIKIINVYKIDIK